MLIKTMLFTTQVMYKHHILARWLIPTYQ